MEFSVDIDVVGIEKVSKSLLKITTKSLNEVSVRAVNAVTESAYDMAREHMIDNINLSDAYVQSQMRVDLARDDKPEATITAVRHGARGTTLTTYGAEIESVPVNWTNQRIEELGHKFGPWPGWTRRKGDASRGIQENQKAAGFTVSVKRAAPVRFNKAFVIPVRGRLLTVRRSPGAEAIRAVYGPAPWQLFRATIPVITGAIEQDLSDRISAEVDYLIDEALQGE